MASVRDPITAGPSSKVRREDAHCHPLRPAEYHRWKSLLGRTFAFLLLLPGLPIIGLLVVLVRLTSRGPGIYRQVRVGLHGKTFAMYKIRTMRCDAEVRTGPAWTQKNDPRVTPVGRVLRKLHLDEFPQLFNVLRGEMALIGPRPERPEFTQVLAREIPGYMDRVLILPGITGLAQINLPPDTDLDSVRRKLVLDLEYVRAANPVLDVRMLACTVLRMLGMQGEFAMRVMRLDRIATLPQQMRQSYHDPDATQQATPQTIVSAPYNQPPRSAAEDDARIDHQALPMTSGKARLRTQPAPYVSKPSTGNGLVGGEPLLQGLAAESVHCRSALADGEQRFKLR